MPGNLVSCSLANLFSMGLAAFFLSFLLWLSASLHFGLAVGLGDVCLEAGIIRSGAPSLVNLSSTPFEALVSCHDGAGMMPMMQLATNATSLNSMMTCAAVAQICQSPYMAPLCPAWFTSNCNRTVIEAMQALPIPDYEMGCFSDGILMCPFSSAGTCTGNLVSSSYPCWKNTTIGECAKSCKQADLKTQTMDLVLYLDTFGKLDHVMNEEIGKLMNCSFIQNLFGKLEQSVCIDLK
jgi:hypothetical protein